MILFKLLTLMSTPNLDKRVSMYARNFWALILCLAVLSSMLASAQEPEDANKKFEEALKAKMEKDRQLIESFMNDDLFKRFDQMFEQMTKDFEQGHFESLQKFFDPNHFDTFLDQSGLFQGLDLGEGKWIENRHERILVLKIALKKEEPLNIEIKNSKVRVSGEVSVTQQNPFPGTGPKEITTIRKINQSYQIPKDVDATKPKFENKDGSVFIRFAKIGVVPEPKGTPDRRPIEPAEGDITI